MLDFVLPTDCFACRAALGPHQLHGACASCWSAFDLLVEPVCALCGLPRAPGTDLVGPVRGRCAACRLGGGVGVAVRAAVIYDAHARRFLLRAKLGRRHELFGPLGAQLAAMVAARRWHEGCAMIVPAPSHPWTDWVRGFSPARELARSVARATGLDYRPRLLRLRLAAPRSSKRLSRPGRRAARAGAVRAAGDLAGARVLLIDDVMTTGATVAECVRALEAAGAREVRIALWARTLPPV